MNWNELIALRISELILKQLLQDTNFELKKSEEEIRKEIEQELKENFHQEKQLNAEVYQMMEDLEYQGHSFERRKMFPMLKSQMAKKKGFVL